MTSDGQAIVRMCHDMQDDWRVGRIRGRDTKEAIGTLSRIAHNHGPSAPPTSASRDWFGDRFQVYALAGKTKPIMLSTRADTLGPAEVRHLEAFRVAGFDVLVTTDTWATRSGVRVLVSNPLDLPLTPAPELDDEMRPGRSFPQPHVRLRASRTGDTVHTPEREPIRGNS